MATRGSKKARSVEQETHVAVVYSGKRSPSSGAAVTDAGDVRTPLDLIECKLTGAPGTICEKHSEIDCKECMKTPTIVGQMEKITDEAWETGHEPVLALRFYCPHSPLANAQGWVDLSVRLLGDDAYRSDEIRMARGEACPEDGVR